MLYTSGNNLESGAISFIEKNESVTLYSAYLTIAELKKINASRRIKQIVVRWEIQDLCLGVSDIELYDYCQQNDIALFRNTRIHLKAFWNNRKSVFFGSANVTSKGLGEKANYNYELNGLDNQMDYDDVFYLKDILAKSEYITESLYRKIKGLVNETKLPTSDFPILESTKSDTDYFLLSQLPMTRDASKLYRYYHNKQGLNEKEMMYFVHDAVLYEIPDELNESDFYAWVARKFNSHPFIIDLKEEIKKQASRSLRYGGVVEWIQRNTTTVPTPRRWELKQEEIVNILYDWICYFDSDYTWDRPSHTQVIFYKKQ